MNANEFSRSLNYPVTFLSRLRSIVWRSVGAVRDLPSVLRNYYERARWGVGHRDAWSFDTYLSGVVATGLNMLADGHSYPLEWQEEDWSRALREHADALQVWHGDKFDLDQNEEIVAYAQAQDSMHWVASVFADLWD